MEHLASKLLELVDLAKKTKQGAGPDQVWEGLEINEHQSYVAVAESVINHYKHIDLDDRDNMLLLSNIIYLLVENMVLQLKLAKGE